MPAHSQSKYSVDLASLKPFLGNQTFDEAYAKYDDKGYIIFENIINQNEVSLIRAALTPFLTKTGRNNFEGFKSNRVYALLAKAPEVFSDMVLHPLALAFAERELGRSCLLSGLLAINLHPGETVQEWHFDDEQIFVPRPRPAYGVSTFWAIDDMTETNGATEIIPGSHKWGDDKRLSYTQDFHEKHSHPKHDDPNPHDDAIKVIIPSGSLMIAKGTLYHRGGANKSDQPRLIVTPQYCPGWARQLENMALAVPKDIAAKLPRRVRELLGYNTHGVFMGYVDGVHPDRSLGILK